MNPTSNFEANANEAEQLSSEYDNRFEHLHPAIDDSIETGSPNEHPENLPEIDSKQMSEMIKILKRKSEETGHDFTSRSKVLYGIRRISTLPLVNQRLRTKIRDNLKFMLHKESYEDAVKMHIQISQFKRNKRTRYNSDGDEESSSEYEAADSSSSDEEPDANEEEEPDELDVNEEVEETTRCRKRRR